MTSHKATRGAVAVLAVTAVLGSFSGVAAQSPSPAGTAYPNPVPESCKSDKPVLGVLLPNTVNPYYIAMRQSFLDNGAAAGFDVQVQIAEDSSEKQLAQAQALGVAGDRGRRRAVDQRVVGGQHVRRQGGQIGGVLHQARPAGHHAEGGGDRQTKEGSEPRRA